MDYRVRYMSALITELDDRDEAVDIEERLKGWNPSVKYDADKDEYYVTVSIDDSDQLDEFYKFTEFDCCLCNENEMMTIYIQNLP